MDKEGALFVGFRDDLPGMQPRLHEVHPCHPCRKDPDQNERHNGQEMVGERQPCGLGLGNPEDHHAIDAANLPDALVAGH